MPQEIAFSSWSFLSKSHFFSLPATPKVQAAVVHVPVLAVTLAYFTVNYMDSGKYLFSPCRKFLASR